MSFLGKILVVVQVVLTILFMAFAGAVSATHTSWKEANKKLNDQLTAAQQNIREEQARAKEEKTSLESQLAAAKTEAALKDAEGRELKARLDTLTAEYDQAKTAAAVKTQLASIAADDNAARQDESSILREVLKKRGEAYDAQVAAYKKLADEQSALAKNFEKVSANYETALKDKATLEQILAANKLSSDPKNYESLRTPPPLVQGKVIEAPKNRSGRSEFVAISLGSDDGVSKGDQMTLYRSGLDNKSEPKFLGKIQIVQVHPDNAVGLVVDKAKNSMIQEGDDVTTGL